MQQRSRCVTKGYNDGAICVSEGSFNQDDLDDPKKLMDAAVSVGTFEKKCPLESLGTWPPYAPCYSAPYQAIGHT
jgi:hypothetical protein